MTIKMKLISIISAICLIIVVFAIHLFGRLKTLEYNRRYIINAADISQAALDFNVENFHTQLEVWEYAFQPNNMRHMAFESHNNTLTILLKQLLQVVSESNENELIPDGKTQIAVIAENLKVVRDDWTSLFTAVQKLEKAVKNGLDEGDEEYELLESEVAKRVNINESIFDELKFNENIDIFVTGQKELVSVLELKQEELVQSFVTSLIIQIIGLLLFGIPISFYISRSITKPLNIFQKGIKKIGQGNLEHKVKIKSKDEFGALATAFNKMTGDLSNTTTSIKMLNKEIEERKRISAALENSERKYRLILENASDVIYEHDLNGNIVFTSPSARQLTGYSESEAMAMNIRDLLTVDSYTTVKGAMAEMLGRDEGEKSKGRSPAVLEMEFVHKDGHVFWVEIKAKFQRNQHGRPVGVLGVARDITRRRKLEEQLRNARKMEAIATLAGGVAHQFNNALGAITPTIDLIEMGLLDARNSGGLIRCMKSSARRMAKLTEQLLAYALGGKYVPEKISANDFVEGALAILGHDLPPEIGIETDLSDDIGKVEVDKTQMETVLSDVVTNSIEAITGEGCIRIRTEPVLLDGKSDATPPSVKPGRYVCLRVEDNGRGMDKETMGRLFEPFFSTKLQGRGLGMASAYGIVQNHDGWMEVDSEVGRGTIVRFLLPAVEGTVEGPVIGGRTGDRWKGW